MACLLLLLAGCAVQVNVPVWHGDEGVASLCDSEGPKRWRGREFIVQFITKKRVCPEGRPACIIADRLIRVPRGRDCPEKIAHELNHLLGNHWVDGPTYSKYREI